MHLIVKEFENFVIMREFEKIWAFLYELSTLTFWLQSAGLTHFKFSDFSIDKAKNLSKENFFGFWKN